MGLKILAFGASSSKNSINKKLATFAANLFQNAEVTVLDLNDFEMPVYSVDKESNIPRVAHRFAEFIDASDLLVISMAEHNGNYSAAFKNIFDWVSRIPNRKVFNKKNILLLSTSPGARGGASSLEIATKLFPFNEGPVIGSLSIPSFHQNFNDEQGLTNPELLQKLKDLVLLASNSSR